MKSELQTISLPKAIKPEHCFKDIETEGVLPDYSPDISRLVRVDAAPCVENVRCDDKCEISGKLVFGLLYESDYKSKLAYTTFTVPFELKCDALAAKEIYPDVRCDCTYLTCRLLGQRKVSIKAKLDAVMTGVRVDDITVAKADGSDLNTFFKTETLAVSLPVARAEAEAEIKENLRIGEAVASVVYSTAVFAPAETEAFDTSAAVKADMHISTLCELPDGGYRMYAHTVPVEVSVKNDAINGDSTLEAKMEYSELSAVADLDEYGENKVINLHCNVRAAVTVRQEGEVTLPLDAFSRKHTCKCTRDDADFDISVPKAGKTVSLERSHETDGDISAVLGSATAFEIGEARVSGNMLLVRGKAKTDVLAQSGESVVSRTFTDDFEDSIPFSGDIVPSVGDITVFESKAELYGDTLNIRAMAFVGLSGDEHRHIPVLAAVELGDADEPVGGGFRFYYPDESETIWDIAKKYRVDPERLMSDNAESIAPDGRLNGKRYITIR